MAKLNIEVNVTGAKDVKDLEKALKQLEAKSSGVENQNTKTGSSFKSMAAKIAIAVTAVYAIQKALRAVTTEGFTYNYALEQAEQGLIALSVAAQDKAIPVMDRYANATREATYTLSELQKINAETPHTLNQTNAIYKAMYISMRGVGATTEEMINLTKKLSIASGAAGIEFNALLAGVDGLASGTVMANSDLGRFLKGLGLTNEKLKETDDVVKLVSDALEDFEAADTMAVAVSNLNNVWSIFAGNITQPIFHGVKNAMNEVSGMMGKQSPEAMQIFSDALVDMANAGVKTIGFVIKAVNQLVGLLETSYAGYLKLAGVLKSGSISEAQAEIRELQRIQKESDYGYFSNQSYNIVEKNIKAKQAEIEKFKEANELRREGERIQEKAVERTNTINKLINDGVKKIKINYGEVGKQVENLEKPLETAFKKITDTEKGTSKAAKAAEKAAKAANRLKREYYEITGQSDKLFQMDVDEVMGDLMKSGKFTAEELSDVYDAMWEKYLEDGLKANNALIDSVSSGISTLANAYQSGGMVGLGQEIGNMLVDGANALIPGLGTAFETIGALFSSSVSQAEIEASIGRVEFDDQSLKNLEAVFETAQNPMLEVTNKMHRHIRNMDANFYSVARALNSQVASGGVDLTGVNFVDTFKSGFLGFSSKTVSLIGSGLKFNLQELGDMMNEASLNVDAYTTTLVQKSSWFGLKNSSKIKETYKDLPPEVVKDMANSFSEGYEAILTAGVSLGLKETDLSNLLLESDIDLGKIDFTGLSPQEVNDRLSDSFSTALSGVVDGVGQFVPLIERFAKGTEYSLETLIRIATEYDQASHLFDLIGASFQEGYMDVTRTWTETYEVQTESALNWFGSWGNNFLSGSDSVFKNIGSGFSGILGSLWSRLRGATETITQQMSATTREVYTVQMQMLDVVEAAGGQQQFQDSMSVFMDSFYDEAEQLEFLTKSVEASFKSLGLVVPETNDEFKALYLTLLGSGTEEGMELAGQMINLAGTFNEMTTATEKLTTAGQDMVNDMVKGYSDSVSALLLGQYSNLDIAAKQRFAEGYSQIALESNDLVSSVDAARAEMELAFRYATTQEEYGVYVDRLVTELRKEVPEATNDDIVERLDTLIVETREFNETIKMTSGVQ